MIEEIKELQNNPERAVYQIGKDKNALILSVEEVTENGEVKDINLEPLAFSEKFLKLNLSKNNMPIYALSELEDSRIEPSATGFHLDRAETIANLSRKLFNDKSKNARYAKEFLNKISGNPLIDEINKQMHLLSVRKKLKNIDVTEIKDTEKNFHHPKGEKEMSAYQMEDGKDSLTMIVRMGTDLHMDNFDEFCYQYLELNLINNSDNQSIFSTGASYILEDKVSEDIIRKDLSKELATKLLDDKSKNASYIKEFFNQINGNHLIDEIKEQIKVVEEEQKRELNNSKLGCVRTKLAKKLGIKTELPKSVKKIEKVISDTILGKTRE